MHTKSYLTIRSRPTTQNCLRNFSSSMTRWQPLPALSKRRFCLLPFLLKFLASMQTNRANNLIALIHPSFGVSNFILLVSPFYCALRAKCDSSQSLIILVAVIVNQRQPIKDWYLNRSESDVSSEDAVGIDRYSYEQHQCHDSKLCSWGAVTNSTAITALQINLSNTGIVLKNIHADEVLHATRKHTIRGARFSSAKKTCLKHRAEEHHRSNTYKNT